MGIEFFCPSFPQSQQLLGRVDITCLGFLLSKLGKRVGCEERENAGIPVPGAPLTSV